MDILKLFLPKKTASFSSEVNGNISIAELHGKKIVYAGGAEQTGGTITGMWKKAFNKIGKLPHPKGNCLVLGLGGGDVIRLLQKRYPEMKIDCVELDPVMIEIAGKFFNLKANGKLKIYRADAYDWFSKSGRKYDLIIVDLFIGFLNPERFRQIKFLKKMKEHLAGGGLVLYNSHYRKKNAGEFQKFLDLCRCIFTDMDTIIEYRFSRIIIMVK